MQHEELDIPRYSPRAAASTQSYRMRRRPAEGTSRMMVIAGAIGGGAFLVIVGWSLIGHGHATIPVIQADSRPLRVKPANPGGLQIAGANDDILSGDTVKQAAALAAPAEIPQTEQLHQLQQAEQQRDQSALAPPAPATPAAAAPPAAPAPIAQAKPAPPPAARPSQAVEAKPAEHVEAKPAEHVEAKPAALAEEKTAAHPPPPVAKSAEASHPAAGKAAVQLAAVGSEEAARQLWQHMAARMPELLNGRKPDVTRIDRQGHIFWRLRLNGFTDTAAADTFCTQVRGKGGGCSIADF